jgi:hypothetical protein
MLLQAAAESNVFKAVVSEGAGARSIRENLEKPLKLGTVSELAVSFVFTAGTALFSNHEPPPNLKSLVGRIAPRSVFLIYALHGTGGEEKQLDPEVLRSRRRAQADVGDPGGCAHRRDHRPAAGIRAPGRRLLRSRAPRLIRSRCACDDLWR